MNRRSCPRDLFVEILEPIPCLVARHESRDVDDLAATSEIDTLFSSTLARVRDRVDRFEPSKPGGRHGR